MPFRSATEEDFTGPGGIGDVFLFDSRGNVVLQAFMTWTGERPENRVLSDEELSELRGRLRLERDTGPSPSDL